MNWTPGAWWRAPAHERMRAYYLCLRVCYNMPALEAWNCVKRNSTEINNLVEDIRAAVSRTDIIL